MSWKETAVNRFFDWLISAIGKKKKYSPLEGEIEIRDIARQIVKEHSGVDFFFIVMAYNNGKKSKEYRYSKWSVVGGYYERWIMPMFLYADYESVPMDYEYDELIKRILKLNEFGWHTPFVDGPNMKSSYEINGVKYCKFFFIRETEKKDALWFLAVGTTQDGEDFESPYHKTILRNAKNKVENIVYQF